MLGLLIGDGLRDSIGHEWNGEYNIILDKVDDIIIKTKLKIY